MSIPSQYLIPVYDDDGNILYYDQALSLASWFNAVCARLNELNSDLAVLRKTVYWSALTSTQRLALRNYVVSQIRLSIDALNLVIAEMGTISTT